MNAESQAARHKGSSRTDAEINRGKEARERESVVVEEVDARAREIQLSPVAYEFVRARARTPVDAITITSPVKDLRSQPSGNIERPSNRI